MRIALSTGGGDAPGLNAVIRGAVLAAIHRRWSVYGIRRGYNGLLGTDGIMTLDANSVRGITHLGGTILGTTNRGDPFCWPVTEADGSIREVDRSDELIAAFRAHGFDALITIGGDGSLRIAQKLAAKGLPVVGVPKTIDNDVGGTVMTFGFDTAVATATEALDKVHSTAESHERVLVVELMGRHAGWIALHAGISGSADCILIPEIPFDIAKVVQKIREREARGRRFSIVVVAEGAMPIGGAAVIKGKAGKGGGMDQLGGICEIVSQQIAKQTGKETRTLTLGHLQRGGSPTTFDRLLSLRFGTAAVRCVADKQFGVMVALQPPAIRAIPLADALAPKPVPLDSDTVLTARDLGICLGD